VAQKQNKPKTVVRGVSPASPVPSSKNGSPTEWMASIGERLRSFRAGRLSINELSRQSGVSSGRISEIERGGANPSFETLWRLASVLEVPIGAFFGGPEAQAKMVVRRDERKKLALPHDHLEYELLTPDLQRALEVFIFRVPAGFDNSTRPISHKGEELIHILTGTLNVQVGDAEFVLEDGDSITYDASTPHFVKNATRRQVVALAVVTPPSF
jgi:transcriptional regulator with XRE-family HTH domain